MAASEQECEQHRSRQMRWRAANPDKVRAARAQKNARNRGRANERFTSPFERHPIISAALFDACQAAADRFVFQGQDHTIQWVMRLPEAQQREIIGAGVAIFLAQLRTLTKAGKKNAGSMFSSSRTRNAAQATRFREKSRAFDRIIEMLDHKMVGDKKLGDCRRADLLRAAALLAAEAGEMTLDAALYRELVPVIGDGTVRQAAGLGKIQGLLTHRWGEDAA